MTRRKQAKTPPRPFTGPVDTKGGPTAVRGRLERHIARAVRVEWRDAFTISEWRTVSELADERMSQVSVGVLCGVTWDRIIIATIYDEDGPRCASSSVIPLGCVETLEVLP